MANQRIKIGLIAVLATLSALYGAWLFTESFLAPQSWRLATWPSANPLQVDRLVSEKDPQNRNGLLQRSAALTVLSARPADLTAWLRLAYADRLIHGRLTADGQRALDASYSITPYAGALAQARVLFVMDNWDTTAERTRRDALAEIGILKSDTALKYSLMAQTPTIRNLNGRIAAALSGVLIPPRKP